MSWLKRLRHKRKLALINRKNRVRPVRTIDTADGPYVNRSDLAALVRSVWTPNPAPCAAEMVTLLRAIADQVEADGRPNLVGLRFNELVRAIRTRERDHPGGPYTGDPWV